MRFEPTYFLSRRVPSVYSPYRRTKTLDKSRVFEKLVEARGVEPLSENRLP